MAKNTEKNAKEYNIRAREEYRRSKSKQVSIVFNVETENNLYEHVMKQPNKSGYVKDLIKKDIEENIK